MGSYWDQYRMRRVRRRGFMAGSAALSAGAASLALVGCGDDDDDDDGDETATTAPAETSSPAATGTAPAGAETPSGGAASPTGSLHIALSNAPFISFNYARFTSGTQRPYQAAIADSLTYYSNPDGTAIRPNTPYHATSVERSPDGLTFTFSLNPDAVFHDGTPVTAEDVKFTWELVRDGPADRIPSARRSTWERYIGTIEAPDDFTVIFNLNAPYPLDAYTNNHPTLSKAHFDAVGFDGYEADPIGFGPFKFARGTLGEFAEFEAVAGHYRQTPRIQTYRLTGPVGEWATRLAMIETGEADVTDVPLANLADIQGLDGVTTFREELTGLEKLEFMDIRSGHTDTALADPRVREAMSKAIDREGITKSLFSGEAVPWGSVSLSVTPGYVDLPPDPYDPADARALLEAAGWGDGFTVEFFRHPVFAREPRLVMMANWQDIGITVNLHELDLGAWLENYLEPTPWKIQEQGVGADRFDPTGYALFEYTDAAYGANADPWFDEMMDRATSSATDEERYEAWGEIQTRHSTERNVCPLWATNSFAIAGPKVVEWPRIAGFPGIHNVEFLQVEGDA